MAWIESHQELGQHPKTKRLARLIGESIPAAIGYLHLTWWWALNYAQDGDLSDYTAEDIADAALWQGEPSEFIDALVTSGFLDREDETLSIHDWWEYAGKLVERREKDRERKRKSAGTPPEIERNTERPRPASVSTQPNPTQPTQPNQPNSTEPSPLPPASGGETDSTSGARQENSRHLHHNGAESPQDARFDEFWATYPKKVGKEAARKAWKRIKPSAEMVGKILTAIAQAKTSDQWRRENGRFIPNPATWLNQGRWDDEITPPIPPPRGTGGNRNGVNTMGVLDSIIANAGRGTYAADEDRDSDTERYDSG